MPLKPLTFVAMPFGKKADDRTVIDFDSIYNSAIKPAVLEAENEMEVIRADEETLGGFIHGPMYERLLLSEIVIADLTLANSNVFYELGIRHCARPKSTILLFSKDTRLPFDVGPLRAIPYELTNGELTGDESKKLKESIKIRLQEALEEGSPDSPLFQLISGFPGVNLKPDQTQAFREKLFSIESIHEKLFYLKYSKDNQIEKIREVENDIGNFDTSSYELLFDLLLTYRAVESWGDMIRVIESFPVNVKESVNVQEQLALALNRRNLDKDRERAIGILNSICRKYGNSSETLGILGRVYKDQYFEAISLKEDRKARGALKQAIECYYKGFEEDPRDYYPGINALTLLFIDDKEESKVLFEKLKPLVDFALERHGGLSSNDYWVLATLLEFASLCEDWEYANKVADKITTLPHNKMQIRTTINNLNYIIKELEKQNKTTEDLKQIIEDLYK
ncbi:TRAFs-binding domain-containing protein [Salsuginibacillus kocurii]|uniref:TRAFs-binding domain-containing protein n=1 Tax=Salsuginibacillus kocurii TaxID=427078 RepID=UPI00037ABE0D|nr:TRAFs-binding domain-containing protein [Salsuginibacillus kocurii]